MQSFVDHALNRGSYPGDALVDVLLGGGREEGPGPLAQNQLLEEHIVAFEPHVRDRVQDFGQLDLGFAAIELEFVKIVAEEAPHDDLASDGLEHLGNILPGELGEALVGDLVDHGEARLEVFVFERIAQQVSLVLPLLAVLEDHALLYERARLG